MIYRLHFLTLILSFLIAANLNSQDLPELVQQHAVSFESAEDIVKLTDLIDNETLVLMGEASHGTNEYYTKRAAMSRHLTSERGFNFIAVEGDWASFSRINEYVKQKPGGPQTLDDAMAAVDRWPLWMWRNMEFKELVQWAYEYNSNRDMEDRIGIYGIDVYAHTSAMDDVVNWISELDSDLGRQAENAYSCMTRHSEIGDYIRMVQQTGEDCSDDIEEVLAIVRDLEDHPDADNWQFFSAEHGAKVAKNAEKHYRANLVRGPDRWNYRASHFYLTAERLLDYYGEDSRGIIWAHNTHIGDARATDMAQHGMHNIGQLSRENLGRENVFAIGFGSYTGNVLAAAEWEGDMQNMTLPDARSDSWEYILEQSGIEKFYLDLNRPDLKSALETWIPHRAVGVTYNPNNEQGNYTQTVVSDRYDAFIFIRTTNVLSPLD